METGTTKILAENDQGVGWLTFNQPERRNATHSRCGKAS